MAYMMWHIITIILIREKEKGNLSVKKDSIPHYHELKRFIFKALDNSEYKYDGRYENLLTVLKREFT